MKFLLSLISICLVILYMPTIHADDHCGGFRDDGTYIICEVYGTMTPEERLEAAKDKLKVAEDKIKKLQDQNYDLRVKIKELGVEIEGDEPNDYGILGNAILGAISDYPEAKAKSNREASIRRSAYRQGVSDGRTGC